MTKNNTHSRKVMVSKPSMKVKPMKKKKRVGAFALFKAPMSIA